MTDSFTVTPEQIIAAFALPKDTDPETVEERLLFAASNKGRTGPEIRELREYKEGYIVLHFPFGVTALVPAEDENLTFRLKSGSSKVHAVWDTRRISWLVASATITTDGPVEGSLTTGCR